MPHAARHRGVRPVSPDLVRHAEALEAQLAEARNEADSLRRALYEAAQLQRRLCGPRHLRRESFEIAAEIFPVRDLSGDFLSVFEMQGEIVFAVGDIAGKGLYAGMWFSHVVGMMRLEMSVRQDPALTVSAMNRALLQSEMEVPLTSLFLARLNPRSGELVYCNAGHPPALLLRADGRNDFLSEGGPLMGVIEGAEFENSSTVLRPGDSLLAYSDGISECRNPAGVEFGMQGLLAAAKAVSCASATATLFGLLAAVEAYTGHHSREDDIGLLVVEREQD